MAARDPRTTIDASRVRGLRQALAQQSGGGGAAAGAHALTHQPGGSDPLTALDAGVLTSGTVADARLSATVARRDQPNTFVLDQTLNARLRFTPVTAQDPVGMQFPPTATPSSDPTTLDEYRESDTWAPTLISTGSYSGQVYAIQNGWWTKVGRSVTIGGHVALSTAGTFTGTLAIGNLPFQAASPSTDHHFPAMVSWFAGLAQPVTWLGGLVQFGAIWIDLFYLPPGGATATTPVTPALIASGLDLIFTVTYPAAS